VFNGKEYAKTHQFKGQNHTCNDARTRGPRPAPTTINT